MFKSLRVLASAASAAAFANTTWDVLAHFHCPDNINFFGSVVAGVFIPQIIYNIYVIALHEDRY